MLTKPSLCSLSDAVDFAIEFYEDHFFRGDPWPWQSVNQRFERPWELRVPRSMPHCLNHDEI